MNKINFKDQKEAKKLYLSIERHKCYSDYDGKYVKAQDLKRLIRLASSQLSNKRKEMKKIIEYLHDPKTTQYEIDFQLEYLEQDLKKYKEDIEFLKSFK